MTKNVAANPNIKQTVPFFMVTNMDKSLEFYTKGLNFSIKNQWEPLGKIEWCWLQLGNAALMLQVFRQTPQSEKLGDGVSIYFICEDALSMYNHVKLNNLTASEPFVGNSMWVVGLKDPDGYKIYFESPTDVPEETIYSDWIKTNAAD